MRERRKSRPVTCKSFLVSRAETSERDTSHVYINHVVWQSYSTAAHQFLNSTRPNSTKTRLRVRNCRRRHTRARAAGPRRYRECPQARSSGAPRRRCRHEAYSGRRGVVRGERRARFKGNAGDRDRCESPSPPHGQPPRRPQSAAAWSPKEVSTRTFCGASSHTSGAPASSRLPNEARTAIPHTRP